RKKGEANTDTQLSEQDKGYLMLIRDLQKVLNEEQMECMISIIQSLALNPIALKSTRKHIQNFLKGRPQA
ncbi:MAG TPA: hypothetical protein VKG26_00950, partial [Bacteroidia bacterium]|nr:hypothetical protein [Bacteroidia bacterium]